MVSVEEYLSTVYRPDCDYIDSEVGPDLPKEHCPPRLAAV
jgi:hypothetical protein